MIQVTDQARRAILRTILESGTDRCGVRIAVVGGGANGYQYAVALVERPSEDDVVSVSDDMHLFVDRTSLPYLKGTTIDFVSGTSGTGFVFHNPNPVSTTHNGHTLGA